MARRVDQRQPLQQRVALAGPETLRWVRAHDVLAVRLVQPHRAAERMRPFHHAAVVMRVRNGDGGDPAERIHQIDGRVVDQRDAIPQHIAMRRAHQQGALADGEIGQRADAVQIRLVPPPAVKERAAHFGQRGPGLPRRRQELPLVQTDRTGLRRRVRGRILGAAGRTDERRHGRAPFQCQSSHTPMTAVPVGAATQPTNQAS